MRQRTNLHVRNGFLTRGPSTRDDELGVGGSWPMAGEHTEVIEARDEGETEHHFPAAEWEAAIERDTLIVRKRDGETVGDGNAESDNLAMAVDRRAHDSGPPRTLAQLGQYMRTFYNRKAR